MAAVEVTISGILYDKISRSTRPCVLIGEATLTGLEIGGGPLPPGTGVPQPPLGIWGPTDPRPSPPIANVPGAPGYVPPGTHPMPPVYYPPTPSHPIVLPPDPPTEPPTEPPTQPPSSDWVWGFVPDGSGGGAWKPVYVPDGGKPQPLPPPA